MALSYRREAYPRKRRLVPHIVSGQFKFPQTYVSLPRPRMEQFSTWFLNDLLSFQQQEEELPQRWEVLRPKKRTKPSGGQLVCLMIGGQRQFLRQTKRDRFTPPDIQTFNSGWKDCYAAWCRPNGDPFQPVAVFGSDPTDPTRPDKRIFAARSGRGALYAATPILNAQGTESGFEIRLFLIEFSVFDKSEGKADLLHLVKTTQFCMPAQLHGCSTPKNPAELTCLQHLDSVWLQLAEQAWRGFLSCSETSIRDLRPNDTLERVLMP